MFSHKSTWGGSEDSDLSPAFKAMEKMGRPKFSDKVTFAGRQRDYPAFMDYVTTAFTDRKIQHLLTEDKTVIPLKFHIPEHPPLNMVGPWESYRAEMMIYQLKIDDVIKAGNAEYMRGVSIIQEGMSAKPLSKVKDIVRRAIPVTEKFDEIMLYLSTTYTQETSTVIMEILNGMDMAPIATNPTETASFINFMLNADMDLQFFDPTKALTESQKRHKLVQHLNPHVFENFLLDMEKKPNNPAWTFSETSDQLDAMMETTRVIRLRQKPSSSSETRATSSTVADEGAATPLVNYAQGGS